MRRYPLPALYPPTSISPERPELFPVNVRLPLPVTVLPLVEPQLLLKNRFAPDIDALITRLSAAFVMAIIWVVDWVVGAVPPKVMVPGPENV